MKKILKILGILLGSLLVVVLVAGIFLNESLPEGKSGPQADALAHKMLEALNHMAYEDTRFLEWSFRNNSHYYKWDKHLNLALVRWDNTMVELDLTHPNRSNCFTDGEEVYGKSKTKIISKAVEKFNNDSFWLVAPYKVFDNGVTRRVVELPQEKALLVTYNKGGSTPGDSYLWLLNDHGFPKAFKMWVNIIPIGGLEASWDDWIVTESGAFLPKTHQFGPILFDMGDVQGYNN